MSRKSLWVPFLLLSALTAAPERAAAAIVSGSVSGNSVTVSVTLPWSLGLDLSLAFDGASSLTLSNLGISATLVNPVDPALGARLPSGVYPSLLPILLRIEPPVAGGLTFHDTVSFELHTHSLGYFPATPLRLFSAPLGGQFRDVTASMGAGSYRARGTTGGFSEFLIAIDTRSVDTVIGDKFARLEDLLEDYEGAMPAPVYGDLETRLAAAHSSYSGGNLNAAITALDGFAAEVVEHSGSDIPNVWRAARDLNNVAGYLQAGAATLRFSLDRKRTLGP